MTDHRPNFISNLLPITFGILLLGSIAVVTWDILEAIFRGDAMKVIVLAVLGFIALAI